MVQLVNDLFPYRSNKGPEFEVANIFFYACFCFVIFFVYIYSTVKNPLFYERCTMSVGNAVFNSGTLRSEYDILILTK